MNIRKKVLPLLLAAVLTGGLASAANPVIPDPLPLAETGDLSRGADNFYRSSAVDGPSLSPICTA